jgi:hypothetical protein
MTAVVDESNADELLYSVTSPGGRLAHIGTGDVSVLYARTVRIG